MVEIEQEEEHSMEILETMTMVVLHLPLSFMYLDLPFFHHLLPWKSNDCKHIPLYCTRNHFDAHE